MLPNLAKIGNLVPSTHIIQCMLLAISHIYAVTYCAVNVLWYHVLTHRDNVFHIMHIDRSAVGH